MCATVQAIKLVHFQSVCFGGHITDDQNQLTFAGTSNWSILNFVWQTFELKLHFGKNILPIRLRQSMPQRKQWNIMIAWSKLGGKLEHYNQKGHKLSFLDLKIGTPYKFRIRWLIYFSNCFAGNKTTTLHSRFLLRETSFYGLHLLQSLKKKTNLLAILIEFHFQILNLYSPPLPQSPSILEASKIHCGRVFLRRVRGVKWQWVVGVKKK